MTSVVDILNSLWVSSGFSALLTDWRSLVMILVACVLLYLGIVKKFEPLLLVGIAFWSAAYQSPRSGSLSSGALGWYY